MISVDMFSSFDAREFPRNPERTISEAAGISAARVDRAKTAFAASDQIGSTSWLTMLLLSRATVSS